MTQEDGLLDGLAKDGATPRPWPIVTGQVTREDIRRAAAAIVCPRCRRISAHPQDVEEGYCGNCHAWTTGPAQPVRDPLGYRPTTPAEIDNSVNPGAWKDHPEGESDS